jgi:uncharacterized membrane protein
VTPEKRPEKRTEKRAERKSEKGADLEERARARLDTPRELRRPLVRRPSVDRDRFGVFAESFARYMGTAKFLIWMTAFVVIWISWNTLAPADLRFDRYAFIFLTLMLSLQASYAAPLILLAQNRQEIRDRVIAEQDRQADAASHADLEFIAREVAAMRMALGEVATRDYVRSELRALLADLDERVQEEAPDDAEEDAGGGAGEDAGGDATTGTGAGEGAGEPVAAGDDPDHAGRGPRRAD